MLKSLLNTIFSVAALEATRSMFSVCNQMLSFDSE